MSLLYEAFENPVLLFIIIISIFITYLKLRKEYHREMDQAATEENNYMIPKQRHLVGTNTSALYDGR